jgi:hypothetical protein
MQVQQQEMTLDPEEMTIRDKVNYPMLILFQINRIMAVSTTIKQATMAMEPMVAKVEGVKSLANLLHPIFDETYTAELTAYAKAYVTDKKALETKLGNFPDKKQELDEKLLKLTGELADNRLAALMDLLKRNGQLIQKNITDEWD